MTISTENRKNLYTGNGSTTVFPYTYRIIDEAHLEVIRLEDDGVTETTLTLNTDYTVSDVGESTGSITYPVSGDPLASNEKLFIKRKVPLTQLVDLINNAGFFAETHEDVFDYLTMITLQMQEELDRAPKVDPTSGLTGDDLIQDVQDAVTAAEAAQTAAEAAQALAEAWASLTTGLVDSTDYSAKEYAIGIFIRGLANGGSAKDWATYTGGTVDDTEYSAKEYAIGIQNRGNAGGGSAKDWASYTGGTVDDTDLSAKQHALDAAQSAADAATNAASSMWNDTQFKVFADSPISIVDGDDGQLFVIDCSGGNVVVNLPAISSLTLPPTNAWRIGFKKSDNSSNTVTINRNGTDEIDGGAGPITLTRQNAVSTLIADDTPTPDAWTSITVGEFPINGAIVGDSDQQVLTNKDYDGGTASNNSRITVPGAAKATLDGLTRKAGTILYATDQKVMYFDDGTSLRPIGSGGGGLDVFFTEDFEVTSASDWTYGNNNTFLGAGASTADAVDETTNPISGDRSLKYTQVASSLNDYGASPLIPLDLKQRGKDVAMILYGNYDGDDDDIAIVAYDATNSNVITSDMEFFKKTDGNKRFSATFYIPSTCENLRIGYHVKVENVGKILIFDSIEITTNPFIFNNLLDDQFIHLHTGNGHGSTNTKIRRFTTEAINKGVGLLTYADDATNGASLTAVRPCQVFIGYSDNLAGTSYFGVSKDSSELTTNIQSIAVADRLGVTASTDGGGGGKSVGVFVKLDAGDVLRFHTNGAAEGTAAQVSATIIALASSEHVITPAKSNMYDRQTYDPTLVGFGTVANKDFYHTRIGQYLYIEGSFDSGTSTATEARIPLPTVDGQQLAAKSDLATNSKVGHGDHDGAAATTSINMLASGDDTYLTIVRGQETNWTPQNGSAILSNGDTFKFNALVPIEGWTSDVNFLAGQLKPKVLILKDKKPNNTAGGGTTAASWNIRDLNEISGDRSFAIFPSNFEDNDYDNNGSTPDTDEQEFELISGVYKLHANFVGIECNNTRLRLRNVDGASTIDSGLNNYENSNAPFQGAMAAMSNYFVLTQTTKLRIEQYFQTAKATDGRGTQINSGEEEVYGEVVIEKIA